MLTPQFKDVKIGQSEYRIAKIPARDASWILVQVLTKLLPAGMEEKLSLGMPSATAEIPFSSSRTQMTSAEFHEIQDLCLLACSRYESVASTRTPLPVMARPGVFAIPELEYDAFTILTLTIHSLMFNVASFFDGKALSELLDSIQDLNPSDASTSMNSYSGQ